MDDHTSIVEAQTVAVTRPRPQLAPIIQEIADGRLTVEQVEAIAAVQERWQAVESKRAYAEAMVRLRAALPTVIGHDRIVNYQEKSSSNRVKYSYMSLAALVDAVAPILADHGFNHEWIPSNTEREVVITFRLTHRDAHSEECTMRAPPDTKGGKSPVQAISSTATTLKRQTMIALLGLATRDLPDADEAPHEEPDTIDPKRNNAMVTALRKRGRKLADAEDLVGKLSSKWTAADRENVGLWMKGQPADDQDSAREPGAEG